MFDIWQFNYTGCYGNDWIKTPHFDRIAREGVLVSTEIYSGNSVRVDLVRVSDWVNVDDKATELTKAKYALDSIAVVALTK